jgi:rare lipoprotein A (peptidoglycan hydrolase)
MGGVSGSRTRLIGRLVVAAAGAGLVLTGCGSFPRFSPPAGGYSQSYHVPVRVGQQSQPETSGHIVKASWYGQGFAGRRTSSGERFNPNQLTAASKTLPIGSVVRVTNVENGRSVNVRINDRGPFVRGRSLDLSRSAAQKIGMTHKGVARVKVTRVKRSTSVATAGAP